MRYTLLIFLLTIFTSCNNDDEAGNINFIGTEIFVSGLSVTIRDEQTDTVLTNGVTIIAIEGDYSEELTLQDNLFIGAGERAGTYSITATATAYVTATINDVLVTEDECHVITKEITINLSPI